MRSRQTPTPFKVGLTTFPTPCQCLPLMFTIAWKTIKINHYAEEDVRLRHLQALNLMADMGGYTEVPSHEFPTTPAGVKWIYIIDLNNDIIRVFLVNYASRMLNLLDIPRWLFECNGASSPTQCCTDDGKHVFLDPISRPNLSLTNVSAQPDSTALDHYRSCAPKLRPVQNSPGVDTFSVRKHFRLFLLTQFYNHLSETFHTIKHQRSPDLRRNFHTLAYSIINLARSDVKVRMVYNKGYSTFGSSRRARVDPRDPYDPFPTTSECWIQDVLVVLDQDILTKENLHAAIGKALQLISAASSSAQQTTPTDHARPAAIVCSLTAIVFVYIRDGEVSHTRNIEFFPQYSSHHVDTVASDGVLALLDIFYHPAQLAEPISFPGPHKYLPTEISQLIFSYACPFTRIALESSCRLFYGISRDYGLRVALSYLQKRSAKDGPTAFIGEAYVDAGKFWTKTDMTYTGNRTRYDPKVGKYTGPTIVKLVIGKNRFGPVYRTFLMMPDSTIVKLEMPLLQTQVRGY